MLVQNSWQRHHTQASQSSVIKTMAKHTIVAEFLTQEVVSCDLRVSASGGTVPPPWIIHQMIVLSGWCAQNQWIIAWIDLGNYCNEGMCPRRGVNGTKFSYNRAIITLTWQSHSFRTEQYKGRCSIQRVYKVEEDVQEIVWFEIFKAHFVVVVVVVSEWGLGTGAANMILGKQLVPRVVKSIFNTIWLRPDAPQFPSGVGEKGVRTKHTLSEWGTLAGHHLFKVFL